MLGRFDFTMLRHAWRSYACTSPASNNAPAGEPATTNGALVASKESPRKCIIERSKPMSKMKCSPRLINYLGSVPVRLTETGLSQIGGSTNLAFDRPWPGTNVESKCKDPDSTELKNTVSGFTSPSF